MKHFVRYLLFPPTCVGCGERFDLFAEEEIPPFCLSCRVRWEGELSHICERCGRMLPQCTCMPNLLEESGCSALYKLCRYQPERRDFIGSRMVLTLKDRRIPRVFAYLGAELSRPLSEVCPKEHTVVTYVPRSRDGVRRSGFDQGKELSRAIAASGGFADVAVFRRSGGSQQKLLSAEERSENVRRFVGLRPEYRANSDRSPLVGKTVILADDVVTTGATMAICTELLLSAGAERVIGVCVAVDSHTQDTNPLESD